MGNAAFRAVLFRTAPIHPRAVRTEQQIFTYPFGILPIRYRRASLPGEWLRNARGEGGARYDAAAICASPRRWRTTRADCALRFSPTARRSTDENGEGITAQH